MKRSSDIYATPRRQSQWAIIFIVLKHLWSLVAQLWPLLAAAYLGRSRSGGFFDQLEMYGAGIGALGMIWGIASYYRYYYHIEGDELVIQKGIIKKVKLNLPFERIQSVNFRQNILHQILGVTAVDIESAGSDQKELQIDALDLKIAEDLRSILLEKKQETASDVSVATDEVPTDTSDTTEEILRLSTRDLIRVGLTQNHLRPVGLSFGLAGSIWFYGYTFGYNPVDIFIDLFDMIDSRGSAVIWTFVLLMALIAMVTYSVVRTWLRHYDLRFWRSAERFQVVQGLLQRQQFSAMDDKIQIISWRQNPLQKLLRFHTLHFSQARTDEVDWKQTDFSIPGCDDERVDRVLAWWLEREHIDRSNAVGISRHYFWHKLRYIVGGTVVISSVLGYFALYPQLIAIVASAIFLTIINYMSYRKKRYAYDGRDIYIGGGVFGMKNSLLPIYKVQNISIQQNPYQSRLDIATLHIHTAAGSMIIPYITLSEAKRLMDDMLYRVEISTESWM